MSFPVNSSGNRKPVLKRGEKYLWIFMLALPVINAIADSTIYYFVEADQEGGLHPGLIRGGILVLFLLVFGYKRIQDELPNRVILVFLLYLLVLSLFSSDTWFSITSGYIKWFIPLMMFPVGLWFFRDLRQLIILNRVLFASAMIVCINLIVAQFTDFGISAYVEDSFFTGGAGVGITNQLALVLLTFPLLFRVRSRFSVAGKWFIYLVGFVSALFVVLAMKRSGIISLAAGSVIYLWFTQSKTRFVRYLVIIAIGFFIAVPLFQTVLAERYKARMKQMENFEDEARYQELFFVFKEFKEGDISQKLFGKEVFNTGRHFGLKYFGNNRMIHSDLSAFLYGSGLVGLLLYLAVYAVIFREGFHYRHLLRRFPIDRELFAIYLAILFATFIISASGSGTIGERCLVFLFLGAVTGVARHKIRVLKLNSERTNGSIPAGTKGV